MTKPKDKKTIPLKFTVEMDVTLTTEARAKHSINALEWSIGRALALTLEDAEDLDGGLKGVTVKLAMVTEQSDSEEG